MTAVDHLPQYRTLTHKMLLPYVVVERAGAQTLCQRFTHIMQSYEKPT